MTATKITSTNSRFVSSGDAFGGIGDFSAAADSLIIDDGGYLVVGSGGDDGVQLDSSGAWTVTVNGSIYTSGAIGYGIFLQSGNAAISNITIGVTGQIAATSSTGYGIYAGSTANIKNAGYIQDRVVFSDSKANTLNNSGTIAQTGDTSAVSMSGGGSMTLTNSGTINAKVTLSTGNDTVTNTGSIYGDLLLDEGNNKYTSTGNDNRVESISAGAGDDTISSTGRVGVLTLGDGKNSVTLFAGGTAKDITLGKDNDTVSSAGSISGDVVLGEGANSFTNSGSYSASANGVTFGSGVDKFVNSGSFNGKINLGTNATSVADTVTNSGNIYDDILASVLTIKNTKYISGDITAGVLDFTTSNYFNGDINSSDAKITNTGTMIGDVIAGKLKMTTSNYFNGDILGGTYGDSLTVSNTFVGNANLAGGDNVFNNSGSFIGKLTFGGDHDVLTNNSSGSISGDIDFGGAFNGAKGDTLTNNGKILGDVSFGYGNDVVTGSGSISGDVFLNDGDDSYTGGNFDDSIFDGRGSDTIKLGGGNDTYYADSGDVAKDGTDTIDGGAGIDVYTAGVATGYNVINIDTVDHDEFDFGVGGSKSYASGAVGVDKITGFEQVGGGDGGNAIFGNAANNVLYGGDGIDKLFGYAGNDFLIGSKGGDYLVGGAGADSLYGGTGTPDGTTDYFAYTKVTDSGLTAATRDLIVDFEDGKDRIVFTYLDSNSKLAGDQHQLHAAGGGVNLLNVAFNPADATPGQFRVIETAKGAMIEVDVSGDAKADMQIEVYDPTHQIAWSISDFIF